MRMLLMASTVLSLSGCSAPAPAPVEPERYQVVAKTFREGFATHPTTAALIQDRQTGCLYSLAEGQGAAPLLTPDGHHAGCHARAQGGR